LIDAVVGWRQDLVFDGSCCSVGEVGDCVLMRSSDSDNAPYVSRVEGMESDGRGGVKVRVRWYYRPEEAKGGRRPFHGAKELFISDHYDTQSAHTIEGKCVVHSFKNYTKLDNVGPEDFYCRFDYRAATGAFSPDRVAVYRVLHFSFVELLITCLHYVSLSYGVPCDLCAKVLQVRDAIQPGRPYGAVRGMQGLVNALGKHHLPPKKACLNAVFLWSLHKLPSVQMSHCAASFSYFQVPCRMNHAILASVSL
jgi:hypothetical protein